MIFTFSDENRFLSNMFPVEINYCGITYPSVENAFQAMKCVHVAQRHDFTKITPPEAKKMGRSVELRKDWEKYKYEIMLDLLDVKFSNPELLHKLHATAPQTLVEGNRWHDNYWGHCTCERCRDQIHHNHLGELLQRKRNLTIANSDIYTMFHGTIYHRDERIAINRPALVYDRDTYTLLRIGDYEWCMGYMEKTPGFSLECMEFDRTKMSVYAICEAMNKCLQYSGYLEKFLKGEEFIQDIQDIWSFKKGK